MPPSPTEPTYLARWFFGWAFSATASTIVSGAVAERMRFRSYLCYTFLVTGIGERRLGTLGGAEGMRRLTCMPAPLMSCRRCPQRCLSNQPPARPALAPPPLTLVSVYPIAAHWVWSPDGWLSPSRRDCATGERDLTFANTVGLIDYSGSGESACS